MIHCVLRRSHQVAKLHCSLRSSQTILKHTMILSLGYCTASECRYTPFLDPGGECGPERQYVDYGRCGPPNEQRHCTGLANTEIFCHCSQCIQRAYKCSLMSFRMLTVHEQLLSSPLYPMLASLPILQYFAVYNIQQPLLSSLMPFTMGTRKCFVDRWSLAPSPVQRGLARVPCCPKFFIPPLSPLVVPTACNETLKKLGR